jgi:hypothetical protein
MDAHAHDSMDYSATLDEPAKPAKSAAAVGSAHSAPLDEPAKPAKSAAEVGSVQGFAKGQAVKANYHGKGQYFAGQIAKVHADGTFDIAYDDGDRETHVAVENLKPLRAKPTPALIVDDSKAKSDKADAVVTAPATPAALSTEAVQPTPVRRGSVASEKIALAAPSTPTTAAVTAPQKLADTPAVAPRHKPADEPATTAVQSSSSSSSSSWAHAIGDRIEAKSHGQWHSGTVVTHCAGSCYGITYDTGEKEINVPEKRLRLPVDR